MKRITGPRARGLVLIAVAVTALAAACAPPPVLVPVTIYNSNPSPVPGNVISQGFQCCQVSEFGDEIKFAGTARVLQSATVTMSNWAIHSTPANLAVGNATGWDQPLTLNIYAVGPTTIAGEPTLGSLLGTVTQTFHIPWRPEPDAINCPGNPTKFQSTPGAPDTNCFNGLANQVTFNLGSLGLTAPDRIVWGVAFNTQSYGAAPIGVDGPYNSLNVGAEGSGASVGSDVDPAVAWGASTWGSFYCDGGAGGSTFRADMGCAVGSDWTGLTPEISFTAL